MTGGGCLLVMEVTGLWAAMGVKQLCLSILLFSIFVQSHQTHTSARSQPCVAGLQSFFVVDALGNEVPVT